MMKLIVSLFTIMLMLSCGSKTGRTVSDKVSVAADSAADTSINQHSEVYIRQRIDTIYKGVGQTSYEYAGRDSAYCSQRYYALMTEAARLCIQTDDILYDYDHWICGQDWSDDWSYTVDKVYNITDTTALADLIIHNFDDSKTTIALLFERNDWYIDDFSPSEDGNDDKQYLRQTIRQCKEILEKGE